MQYWLSLPRILENTRYLEQFIRFFDYKPLDQAKRKLLVSRITISSILWNFLENFSNKFSGPLNSFLLLSWTFLNISETFLAIFFLKLVFFQHPVAQLLHFCRQEWAKTPKSFFLFFFLIECFYSIFLSLDYSTKLLFKDLFLLN